MKIDIWTDFTCPFCYISRRSLQQAIESLQLTDKVEINYLSYILYPHPPIDEDETIQQSLSKKYGIPEEEAKMMMQNVGERAKLVGLEFQLENLRPRNTKVAHRLAKLASLKGLEEPFQEKMLEAFFVRSLDISRKEVLTQISLEVGLNEKAIQQVLSNSAAFEDEVEEDLYMAQRIGVRGIPHFIVDDQLTLSGAQSVNVYKEFLEKAQQVTNSSTS